MHHPAMTWNALASVDFGFNQPFRLVLADSSILYCEQVIRLVPRCRLVVFATWNDRPVVAKLLFSQRSAEQFAREVQGVQSFIANNIPTPALYFADTSYDKRLHILVFERIINAQNVEDSLQSVTDHTRDQPLIQALVRELATQHALGIVQRDLHLKNFLVTSSVAEDSLGDESINIYTLDGADIEVTKDPVSKAASLDNLSLLLSQFSIALDNELEKLFQLYTQLRGWIGKDTDVMALKKAIKHWRKVRWQRHAKKIFRDCSQFAKFNARRVAGMVERSHQSAEFSDFLKNPDAIFSDPDTVILKSGRSSTVAKVTVGGKVLVVKRYNLKGLWHRLRRCLRITRARRSWYLAQKLYFFGIPTAKTVAFVERRYLGLRGRSYLVMEWVTGVRGDEYFSPSHVVPADFVLVIERILLLVVNVAKLQMTHGDLKMTNIFIDQYFYPLLVDLDGMQEHKRVFSLRRALHKEVQRLLDNFRDQHLIKQIFMKIFAL